MAFIVKVVANKLKMVLKKIISKSQNAFIKGKQILDHVLIANKCLYNRVRSRVLGVLCNLDLEKAYGYINWDFFVVLAEEVRFLGEMVYLDGSLYLFGMLFCFVNCTLITLFGSSRSLRLGDPLSSLLFVIVMETLGKMITVIVRGGGGVLVFSWGLGMLVGLISLISFWG